MLLALHDAGRSRPELAGAYAQGRAEANRLRRAALGAWPAGSLRDGMSVEEAVDVYAALCNGDVYRVLTSERGWSPDHVERWLCRTVQGLLLG